MVAIVTFIGWHDSGKTTLAAQVVTELKTLGYRVAVIKSSSESDVNFDTPGTDTSQYKEAGSDSVMFVAPDQTVLQTTNKNLSLTTLAHRYFSDVDIVIGEGFKRARKVAKIEVFRNRDQRLRDEVHGVIAIATDLEHVTGDYVFRLDEPREIALFLEKRYLQDSGRKREVTSLLVNGHKIPLKEFIQESLAGTIHGYVQTLKLVRDIDEIEVLIRIAKEK